MDRRTFIQTSSVAGMGLLANAGAGAAAGAADREFYEFRVYEMQTGNRKAVLHDYLAKACIPAWGALGCGPVGVFSVVSGANALMLYVLVPYPSLEAYLTAPEKMAADTAFAKAAEPYLSATIDNPAYVRFDSSLLRAFTHIPKVRIPAETAQKQPRIFELRTYESHSEAAALRKIEMFNEGGEIALFDRIGLRSVFFGQTLAGQRQPNLVYMTVHADMAAREKVWDVFRNSPDWKTLSSNPRYANTVSATAVSFLRPTDYSQI